MRSHVRTNAAGGREHDGLAHIAQKLSARTRQSYSSPHPRVAEDLATGLLGQTVLHRKLRWAPSPDLRSPGASRRGATRLSKEEPSVDEVWLNWLSPTNTAKRRSQTRVKRRSRLYGNAKPSKKLIVTKSHRAGKSMEQRWANETKRAQVQRHTTFGPPAEPGKAEGEVRSEAAAGIFECIYHFPLFTGSFPHRKTPYLRAFRIEHAVGARPGCVTRPPSLGECAPRSVSVLGV